MSTKNHIYRGVKWKPNTRSKFHIRDAKIALETLGREDVCLVCSLPYENGRIRSLDHVKTHKSYRVANEKPDNSWRNIVTVCLKCNRHRSDADIEFYGQVYGPEALNRVLLAISRPI